MYIFGIVIVSWLIDFFMILKSLSIMSSVSCLKAYILFYKYTSVLFICIIHQFLSFYFYHVCVLLFKTFFFLAEQSYSLFQSNKHSILIKISNPFTFNVIIDIVRFKSTILLFSLCYISLYSFVSHFKFFGFAQYFYDYVFLSITL